MFDFLLDELRFLIRTREDLGCFFTLLDEKIEISTYIISLYGDLELIIYVIGKCCEFFLDYTKLVFYYNCWSRLWKIIFLKML